MRFPAAILAVFCLIFNGFASEPEKLNLVFCSLNYQDQKDFVRDTGILLERLKRTKPFGECMERIKVHYVEPAEEEKKTIFQPVPDLPPLKVRKKFIDQISSGLKSNFKLVIIDALGSLSCAELSEKDKLSLIILGKNQYKNTDSFAKGFLHELGHALGLRDECVSCADYCPPGPPNCAADRSEAEKLWGDLVGKDERVNYISGCGGNMNYIRPTVASLMNNADQAEDFGPVNERYLRGVL